MLEAEQSPLLEAAARERLVKTQEAGKGLAGAVEISFGAVIACSSESSINPFTNANPVHSHTRTRDNIFHCCSTVL
jgi:hypothetical protein